VTAKRGATAHAQLLSSTRPRVVTAAIPAADFIGHKRPVRQVHFDRLDGVEEGGAGGGARARRARRRRPNAPCHQRRQLHAVIVNRGRWGDRVGGPTAASAAKSATKMRRSNSRGRSERVATPSAER